MHFENCDTATNARNHEKQTNGVFRVFMFSWPIVLRSRRDCAVLRSAGRVSHFRVCAANRLVAEWAADDHLPARKVDSSSSTRRVIPRITLRRGDEIRIEGVPDGRETAALDYVEIVPADH